LSSGAAELSISIWYFDVDVWLAVVWGDVACEGVTAVAIARQTAPDRAQGITFILFIYFLYPV